MNTLRGKLIFRQQLVEMGNDEVTCEINSYTVYVTNKTEEGQLIDQYRGFNHAINAEFTEEENYVLFTVRENVRKTILEFEHDYATWNHLRMQARQGQLESNQELINEIGAGSTVKEEIEFHKELNRMIKIVKDEPIKTAISNIEGFVARFGATVPYKMVLTEDCHQMITGVLKTCLLDAVESVSKAQLDGLIPWRRISHMISNYVGSQLNENWRRITTINMGKLPSI